MKIKKYYEVKFNAKKKSMEEYMKEIEETVKTSVKYHKIKRCFSWFILIWWSRFQLYNCYINAR
jgi:hypothetical protein